MKIFGLLLFLVNFSLYAQDNISGEIKDRRMNEVMKTEQVPSNEPVLISESSEKWKGAPQKKQFTSGGLFGLGVFNGSAAFSGEANFGFKLMNRGFAPDLNNQVFLEVLMGPNFLKGSTAWRYGAQLRWDFTYDLDWTFYAIGGLGGFFASDDLGGQFQFFPRFGVGAFLFFTDLFALRGEISHEATTIGFSFWY
ncbi:MAG: hypothetical protein CL678_07955 [Bdellovibrionaceae bacterium]|nr:hypothetical protein [Pseudobdellovibrionaceae bacterium]|tara:strand:- start:3292 stop:3876 length:585 start_codon:yes stop_codon:yes gene_type:complete